MSTIGSPIETSLLQTAQAQQAAGKARDREKAATESGRRYADQVELRVAGVEDPQAIRPIPHTESEQAEEEHRSHDQPATLPADADDQQAPRIDLTA